MWIVSYLKKRALLAQVAAELKAQSGDQKLVEAVCFSTAGVHTICELADERFREPSKLRYFMITTFLLAETMRILNVPVGVKGACLELLNQRRERINGFSGQAHGLISEADIDDLDEITDIGIQLYWSERRQFMADQMTL